MSGRWLTIVAVSGCLLMVAFALWKRSQTTAHVREFWGASQASLIQHGSSVKLRMAGADAQWGDAQRADTQRADTGWQDISTAPGLVHLRATLVDDRYYQWNAGGPAQAMDAPYILQFANDERMIELAIDPASGVVTNIAREQSVPLIPASRQAVAAYLKQIVISRP